MSEFLIVLGLVWLIGASVCDIKKREIPNWLNFSLIIFALGYRAFYSVFASDWKFFVFGLIGLGTFFILAEVFYYSRVFAGGDAKLMMALGPVLPMSSKILVNLGIFLFFILSLLFIGSIYGLIFSFVLVLKNKKNFFSELKKELKERKTLFYVSFGFAFVSFVLSFSNLVFIFFPVIFILLPFLFVYAKAVERGCMIKEIDAKDVVVGDWLVEEVKIGKKVIKPNWEGLGEEEVEILSRLRKKIKIREGIIFAPVFLISFVLLLILIKTSFILRIFNI